jgi:hypothetical protein
VADLPETVLSALAVPVATALPGIASRIPPGPAAELGRLGVPRPERPVSFTGGQRAFPAVSYGEPGDAVTEAQRELGPLLAERLLGALELTIAELDLTGAPDLSGYLTQRPDGQHTFSLAGGVRQSETQTATMFLRRLRPGTADLAASLTRQLAGHRLVAPLLAVSPDVTQEAPIAAAHGAAYLALAVAAASAVVGQWQLPGGLTPRMGSRAAAVVGVAMGVAALLLRESPMPAGYAAALLERIRAEYRLPARGSSLVTVSGHRLALAEGEVPATADFSGNGLVTVVPGGALIRTGVTDGTVTVELEVAAQQPELEQRGWDEVVEVSWRAATGQASLPGTVGLAGPGRRMTTPPWPGDYRLRVHATGRDDPEAGEHYKLAVWQAPAAEQIVYKRTDKLGYQLRGEPEPARPAEPPRPEHAYRWVADSQLQTAATVTMVTKASLADVVRAFGADPARPVPLESLDHLADVWVAVLETGGAVVAIENNGFQGTDERVLCRASASGRAASMFWNVNAVTRLSFAEGGQLLASFQPGLPEAAEEALTIPSVAAALDGLDLTYDDEDDDYDEDDDGYDEYDYKDFNAMGLVAVERFTGHGFRQEDLQRLDEADVAYRIAGD